MAFYISPPTGRVGIEELHHLAKYRLLFLEKVLLHHETRSSTLPWEETDFVQNSDTVIEMTTKDVLSHFILRLCASFSKTFAAFFVKSETCLFQTRYEHFNATEKKDSLCWVKKQIKHLKRKTDVGPVLNEYYKWILVVVRHLETDIIKKCGAAPFKIPFQYLLDMVSQRNISLSQGMALVTKETLESAWFCLYKSYLVLALEEQNRSCLLDDVRSDPRVMSIVNMLLEQFNSSACESDFECGNISSDSLDDIQKQFPLCMQHLHQKLRKTHRLQHHSRIQYTLFLKEAGLSLEDALVFWHREYEQDPRVGEGDHTVCTHHWKKDSQKYLYGIRHLYGAEGARKNYSAHTCQSLQSIDRASSDVGGCPFVLFDPSYLNQLMGHLKPKDCQDIVEACEKNAPQQACLKYYLAEVDLLLHEDTLPNPKECVSPSCCVKSSLSHCGKNSNQDSTAANVNITAKVQQTCLSYEKKREVSRKMLFNEMKPFIKPIDYFKAYSKLLTGLSAWPQH